MNLRELANYLNRALREYPELEDKPVMVNVHGDEEELTRVDLFDVDLSGDPKIVLEAE